ncbi:sigma-70 family RNA polymerase sigma factor [Nocardioides mangrovi]|uniref:Sigma-70 family RNA polymerase sigma factor n=1 Tax=Nocardioides mangrovi TaxID=2874580 RepID=A0ABS7UC21_9ACTN|nr:sigma-70 family RNA polymerase sigma factor [Nocardioides mangrovi]MBZ5738535.1 sigma-70 family RNA polymerase sigma factor [Nocardioides mangrovi]
MDQARADESLVDHTREGLVLEHVVLVHAAVRDVAARVPASVDRADLTSAGLEALVAAARSFDPDRGVPFAAYARTRIRGALLDELRSYDWATRSVRRTARDIESVRNRMAAVLGGLPSAGEVAQALGVDVDVVHQSDRDLARAAVASLDEEHGAAAGQIISRGDGPEGAQVRHEQVELVADAIEMLPPRLRIVVRGYFLEEQPMSALAAELGVTESRVSQLRAEALVLLRTVLNRLHDEHLPVPEVLVGGAAERRQVTYVEQVARRHASRRPWIGQVRQGA